MSLKMKWFLLSLILTAIKGETPYINVLQYKNITIADAETICSYFIGANVTQKCEEQLEVVCGNPSLLMTVLDASSKFPYPGLAYSTMSDYGNFDQCMSLDYSYTGGRVLGEYCAVGLIIPITENITSINDMFQLAVCRPDACSADDYNAILEELSVPLPLFQDALCITSEGSELTPGDIAVITLFGIIVLIMVASTIYDIFLYRYSLKSTHPLLLSFSVLSNGRKLLHISKHTTSKEQIETFHGIRAISMMWIIAGHGLASWPMIPVTNSPRVNSWQDHMSSFYMTAAPLSVDTFFFMSGFLLAFQYFKSKTKTLREQVVSVPGMVIHRYLRLTPPVLMIFLVTITFFIHLGSGPVFTTVAQTLSTPCEKYWWRYFLYIQNYFDFSDTCLLQTWYLSADMQLFLISPLILIPVYFQLNRFGFKSTMMGLLGFNIFCTMLPLIIKLVFRDYTNEYDTHSRLIDYYIGVMLGLHMRIKMDKPFLHIINESHRSMVNLITWPVVILGMLVVLICYQDQAVNRSFESITVFQSFMRPAWCIGLSWITYSCYHGQGGFINWILCRPIFQILGRLTYCTYLVHISVIAYYVGTARTKWYFSEYHSFYQFCGHYLMSLIVATFWTLAFESPLITVEKYFRGRGAKEKEPAKEDTQVKNGNIENGVKPGTYKQVIL